MSKLFFRLILTTLTISGVFFGGSFFWRALNSDKDPRPTISTVDYSTQSFTKNQNQPNVISKIFEINNSSSKPKINKSLVPLKIILPILMYHHIDTVPDFLAKDTTAKGLRVSPKVFEQQLQYLQTQKYNTINSFQLQQYLDGEFELPNNPVMLTFDDGYKDNYDNAFPLLLKYSMVGDFAIVTSKVEAGEYISWQNLKSMLNSGMSVSSHTVSHCTLAIKDTENIGQFLGSPVDNNDHTSCSTFAIQERLNTGQLEFELSESKKILEQKLGIKVSHLVYPFGFHNTQVHDIAKRVGYQFATTVVPQTNYITDFTNPFELGRIRVQGQQDGSLNGFFVE